MPHMGLEFERYVDDVSTIVYIYQSNQCYQMNSMVCVNV